MKFHYKCNFKFKDCIGNLGLEDRGRVQQVAASEILRLSDSYIPFDTGRLKDSGYIADGGEVIVWSTPYANYMWSGIVYEDPELHCAGFLTEDGWKSRKGVQKVPTARKIQYGNGNNRGNHWVKRMMQNGGNKQIEKIIVAEMKK